MAVPELALVLTGGVVVGILSRWLVGWLAEEPAPSFAITIPLQVAISAIAVFAAPHGAIVPAFVLGWSLGMLVVIDLIALRLPDTLTLPLIAAGLLWAYLTPGESLSAHLIGAAVGFGVFVAISVAFRRLRNAEGLGLGDAKLLAAAGAWLGWRPLPVAGLKHHASSAWQTMVSIMLSRILFATVLLAAAVPNLSGAYAQCEKRGGHNAEDSNAVLPGSRVAGDEKPVAATLGAIAPPADRCGEHQIGDREVNGRPASKTDGGCAYRQSSSSPAGHAHIAPPGEAKFHHAFSADQPGNGCFSNERK